MDRYQFREKIHKFLAEAIEQHKIDLCNDPMYSDGLLIDLPEEIDGEDSWELYKDIVNNEIDWSTV